MRLLIVQYAGDYREAVQRLAAGGDETYYAQRYSVDAVAEIGRTIEEAAVLCCKTTEPYNELTQNGVRAIGAGFQQSQEIEPEKILKLIDGYNPTHLIISTPIKKIISWCKTREIPVLMMLADSFSNKGLRSWIGNQLLVKLLNNKNIGWIGNHGINSSIALQKIGVDPEKIIPWDWPSIVTPESFDAKTLNMNINMKNLIYVGSVIEAKGVGDLLEAMSYLKAQNCSVKLKIAGKGDIKYFANKVKQLQIEECIYFLGLVPNNSIVQLMRKSDLVIIPSRHEYPEGFPLTIYEALCSRTPIIASDHPMFKNKLKDGINALIFSEKKPIALAEAIKKALSEPELYLNLSQASYKTWKSLQIPVKWADMIKCWVYNSHEDQEWLFKHRLASGLYKEAIE